MHELSSLAKTHGAALIVDATQSGCGATGKNFWGFDGHADYVCFGRRSYAEGFYSRAESKVASITFGGDLLRLMQFKVLKDIIESERLIDKVSRVG